MENIENMDWEEITPPENAEQEMKDIHNNIRAKNRKLIATSILLALLILWGIVAVGIPLVEKLYWNPEESTYTRTDLETTLHAYTELFKPDNQQSHITAKRTGFATYDLEIELYRNDWHTKDYHFGTLERNELKLSQSFLKSPSLAIQSAIDAPNREYFDRMNPPWQPIMQEMLETLPDYMQVQAAVSFSEDISMETLLQFKEDYPMVDITWVAIRTEPISEQWPTLCGMAPWRSGKVYDDIFKDYPYFMMSIYYEPPYLEKHFESLLRYSADQMEKGRGIPVDGNKNYYQEVLSYIEENGVKSYGCLVTAKPEYLLEMIYDDRIYHMNLSDAWIIVNDWYIHSEAWDNWSGVNAT